jgi:hypothetical protein
VNLAILPTLSYLQVIFSSVNLPSEEHKMQGYSGVVLQKRYVAIVTTLYNSPWRSIAAAVKRVITTISLGLLIDNHQTGVNE